MSGKVAILSIEAFLLCFQETYASEQPAHLGRDFRGHK